MPSKKYLDQTGLTYLWGKIKSYIANALATKADASDIPSPDWDEDDSTSKDYIQNRPAIRASDGENSVVENNIEDDSEATTYTIYVTGGTNATEYTYTTEDTLPSNANLTLYGVAYNEANDRYVKINKCSNGQLEVIPSLSSTALTNNLITIYYKYKSFARGGYSHAEGYSFTEGNFSHAEGASTYAYGGNSHAEGYRTVANGSGSHAEGYRTQAGTYGHAEGNKTKAIGASSHAEGCDTIAESVYSHSEGYGTQAKNNSSHAEGIISTSAGYYSHSEGGFTFYLCHITGGAGATTYTITSETKPPMFTTSGYSQLRVDTRSGSQSSLNSSYMITPTSITIANDKVVSFTLEKTLDANNAIDRDNMIYLGSFAGGDGSHAEGVSGFASGKGSHAEGNQTYATNSGSHSEGLATVAFGQNQHVQGKFNIGDGSNTYAHIVGNGTSDSARSNAHTLDWSGNGWYAGKLTVGAAPTADMDVATKVYVDTAIGGFQRATAEEINEMCLVLGMSSEIITTNDYTVEEGV